MTEASSSGVTADRSVTFVTVVYEAELALLEVQARSMAQYVPPASLEEIIVIDNTRRGIAAPARTALLEQYGANAARVRFLRPRDIVRAPGATGWRSQQVLKLAVARLVTSDRYIALDAKNHFVAAYDDGYFFAIDGRMRNAAYSFEHHPLRGDLSHVLGYLGLDPERYLARFPATVTPFVLDRAIVLALMNDLAHRSGTSFATEFLASELTEFFLYSGWIIARGPGLDEVYDTSQVQCPTVWPKSADVEGVGRAIDLVAERGTAVFSVHRRAFPRLDDGAIAALSAFWVSRGLFRDHAAAARFIDTYRSSVEREARVQRVRDLPARILRAPRSLRRRLTIKFSAKRPR